MLRKTLLACGILSSLLYVGIDVLAAMRYGDYHNYTSRAISELYAIGAPTKQLVDPLFIMYGVLLMAFGVGVRTSPGPKPSRLLVPELPKGSRLIMVAAKHGAWIAGTCGSRGGQVNVDRDEWRFG